MRDDDNRKTVQPEGKHESRQDAALSLRRLPERNDAKEVNHR